MAKKSESVSRETGRARFREEYLDDMGREKVDSVPMAPPIGYQRPESMIERMRSMIRSEHLRIVALQAGAETFEEADDFEVGDDYDPNSPYEEVFDPVDSEARMQLRQQEYRASVEARLGELSPMKPQGDGDGKSGSDKGRVEDRGGRSGRSDEKRQGKSKSGDKPDDSGSLPEAYGDD